MKYRVIYEIDVECDTPMAAALEVEKTLNNMSYRPTLRITDENCKCHVIDLEEEYLNPKLVRDDYENGLCPDCFLEIPEDAEWEGECDNCEHIWNYPTLNQGDLK